MTLKFDPWAVANDGSIVKTTGEPVLRAVLDSDGAYLAATPVNRTLAAAAPELYTACEKLVDCVAQGQLAELEAAVTHARALLAKARGEET